MGFDLSNFLEQGLVLREKEFRAALKSMDWNSYQGKWVAVTCSADAIVPTWAFMLVLHLFGGRGQGLLCWRLGGFGAVHCGGHPI